MRRQQTRFVSVDSQTKQNFSEPRRRRRVLAVTAAATATAALVLAGPAARQAAALNWDPTLTNSTNGGGSGNWDLSTTNWFNGSSDVAWTDVSPGGTDPAIFGGTAGTISLNSNLSAI